MQTRIGIRAFLSLSIAGALAAGAAAAPALADDLAGLGGTPSVEAIATDAQPVRAGLTDDGADVDAAGESVTPIVQPAAAIETEPEAAAPADDDAATPTDEAAAATPTPGAEAVAAEGAAGGVAVGETVVAGEDDAATDSPAPADSDAEASSAGESADQSAKADAPAADAPAAEAAPRAAAEKPSDPSKAAPAAEPSGPAKADQPAATPATKAGWDTSGGARRYLDASGTPLTGAQTVDGADYYFDPATGAMATSRLVTVGGRTCYYGADGRRASGEAYVDGAWRYFDPATGAMATSSYETLSDAAVPGGTKTVWYGADGAMAFGEVLFGSESSGGRVGAWRFFDPKYNGDMARDRLVGLTDPWGPKTVWYGDGGAMAFGEAYAQGAWRCFDEGNGAMARSRFLGLADAAVPGGTKTVWYGADGAMAFGEARADGAWRFFDPKYNGDMARDRFVGLTDAWGPKTVWYGDGGAMAFGEAYAGGAWRCFDEGNGALLSGDRVMARVLAAARACVGQSEDQAWSYLYDACASGADWCEYGPCIATVWHFFKAAGVPHFLTGDLVPGWPHEAFDWLSARGRISQTPRVGSVVFFNYGDHGWMQGLSAAHAEIVTGVDANGAVRSIGALAGGILTHVLDTWAIVGYGLPAYF